MNDLAYLDQLLAVAEHATRRTDRAAARAEAARVLDRLEQRAGAGAHPLARRLANAPRARGVGTAPGPDGLRHYETINGRVVRVA